MVRATARRRQGYTHDVEVSGHRLVIDEPEASGGANEGPSPTRIVAAALAACTAITTEMYADRKGWDVGELEVDVEMEYGDTSVPRSFASNGTVLTPDGLSTTTTCASTWTIASRGSSTARGFRARMSLATVEPAPTFRRSSSCI